jgi:hypothetical protein
MSDVYSVRSERSPFRRPSRSPKMEALNSDADSSDILHARNGASPGPILMLPTKVRELCLHPDSTLNEPSANHTERWSAASRTRSSRAVRVVVLQSDIW